MNDVCEMQISTGFMLKIHYLDKKDGGNPQKVGLSSVSFIQSSYPSIESM